MGYPYPMFEFLFASVALAQPTETLTLPKENTEIVETITKSTIPQQFPLNNAEYTQFREKAAIGIPDYTNLCAKFVNKLFYQRFDRLIFGSAWTIQLHPDNQRFLDLVWRIDGQDFYHDHQLNLKDKDLRIKHFSQLYSKLKNTKHPIGVAGFVYRYSFYKEEVATDPNILPQTHIAMISGKMDFFIENTDIQPKTVEQVLTQKNGIIHQYERAFVNNRVELDLLLLPGQRYRYTDYLVEEQFKTIRASSLLEVFLRKHRNNRVTPLLRPVSLSLISAELQTEMEKQQRR